VNGILVHVVTCPNIVYISDILFDLGDFFSKHKFECVVKACHSKNQIVTIKVSILQLVLTRIVC